VPAERVPVALQACDILAMPFPDFPHYRENMSPLKMFEYMAAGKPIITSDLPPIRDVLSEQTAFFCQPGEVASLRQTLEYIATHSDEAATRAVAACELVSAHTWTARMQRILSAL
jgi:glycosyltransferase involved in cell wall biosynthesis